MKKALVLLFVCPGILTYAQSRKEKKALAKANIEIISHLKAHVQYLAGDSLEGRRTGTPGELLAMQYISRAFEKAGLEPAGTKGYEQAFPVPEGKKYPAATNQLTINDQALSPDTDYFPFPWSAQQTIEGSATPALREKGEPWFRDVKELLDENKHNPHFDIEATLREEAGKAVRKGAKALFVFNSGSQDDGIRFSKNDSSATLAIPVVYIKHNAFVRHIPDITSSYTLHLKVQIEQSVRTGRNVVGFINNNAPVTVIIGAHYDHVGYGEDGNTLDGAGVIHNGADDNASGTAALLELARLYKSEKDKSANYLFIAFSGEELGLLGSKYWLEHPTVTVTPAYMINMDMIGRYNSAKPLTVGGYGTSTAWAGIIHHQRDTLAIHTDSSGAGPSDHASFYRKGIPVLFFFTNGHEDYHKAGDDWEKINFEGELAILRYIQRVIQAAAPLGKLPFSTTRETSPGPVHLPVTLGIMPDYSFTGTGVRVDGVSKGKTAEKAGILTGDILLQLGDYKFNDVMSYMEVLRKFKKGDKTVIRFTRGNATQTVTIEL